MHMHPASTRSAVVIALTACAIVIAGSLMSVLVTAISNWLTAASYVVPPGSAF